MTFASYRFECQFRVPEMSFGALLPSTPLLSYSLNGDFQRIDVEHMRAGSELQEMLSANPRQ